MALGRGRRSNHSSETFWPGYVDILSTLLLTVIFLMSLFMVSQFLVSQQASGKDNALKRLTKQISELTNLLSLGKDKERNMQDELASLQATLSTTAGEKVSMQELLTAAEQKLAAESGKGSSLALDLSKEKELSAEATAKLDLLNQQLLALRRQIAALEEALNASEKKDSESQTQIADLGQRLNAALAKKVQELSQYRSEFFGRLNQLLAGRKDIQVVGDRFVFQAEVLFPSGSDLLNVEGYAALDPLATALTELEGQIPKEVNWVLRVDGHTDIRPISGAFRSNWELSSARAISVVKYLITRGVSPNHLVAAGFGENQPIDPARTDEAYGRNRRIELKLTER
jgi:chemotaxis protein MotB